MFLKIKPLQGAECEIEIDENSSISALQDIVKEKLKINTMFKKMVFVYKGKPLSADENKILKDYNILNGEKVNLLLKPVISNGSLKSENETELSRSAKFDHQLKEHLFKYYNEEQVDMIIKKFHQIVEEKVKTMNYSDLEQLSRLWFTE